MNSWLLGIIGVVFLGVMLEAVLPEGRTNAFIKSIFIILFIYVVMNPIIKLIKNNDLIDFSQVFSVKQDEYLEQLKLELKYKIENHLYTNGVEGVYVEIEGNVVNNDIKINKINVNISNIVINKQDEHIDKYKLITGLIMDIVKVDKESIVYG